MIRTLLIASICLATFALADVEMIKIDEVGFLATGPAGLKIDGRAKTIDVKTEGETVVLRVPLDSLDTGIDLRNRHMKEKYLDTNRYPPAELRVARAMLKEGAGQTGKGTFSVHGTTQDVALQYDVVKSAQGLSVKGNFDINLKAHDILVPNYLGVTVKPDVKITAAFLVRP